MTQPTLIITGASQGLGAAMASLAADRGAQVVLTARSKPALEERAHQIEQRGGKALVVAGDIANYEDCQRFIEQTLHAFGKIDALVNNAAVIEPFGSVVGLHPDAWAQHLAVNLLGPVQLCQLAVPYLRQAQGRIINLTSHAAEFAIPGASAYSTSKAALNRFTKVLAVEEPAITVILFIPGEVDTPMQAAIRDRAKGKTPDSVYQHFIDLHEKGQLLPPEIPARAAVSLALKAPQTWSGEILEWDDPRLQELEG